jgi:hypothetical protein
VSDPKPYSREWLLERAREASVGVAKSALACPGMYQQGCALHGARQRFADAKRELEIAEKAWSDLIAPAAGWAPDPFAQERKRQSQKTGIDARSNEPNQRIEE